MCKDWLRAYGYDTTGKKKDLKARIIAIKNDRTSPNKLVEDYCCSENVVNNLIGSLLSMISCIMKKEVIDTSIFKIEREIKLFLSNLNIFEKSNISSENNEESKKTKTMLAIKI